MAPRTIARGVKNRKKILKMMSNTAPELSVRRVEFLDVADDNFSHFFALQGKITRSKISDISTE